MFSKHSVTNKIGGFAPLSEESSIGSDRSSIDTGSISGSIKDKSLEIDKSNKDFDFYQNQSNQTKSKNILTISSNLPPMNKNGDHLITLNDSDKQFKEPLTEQPDSGLTLKVLIGAFVAFFTNSFASGYNMGVLNTPEQILKTFFNNSLNNQRTASNIQPINENQIELIWSIAVSILVVGALTTSIITGFLANRLGRRGVIFLNVSIGMFAMFLTWGSKYMQSVPMFLSGRLVAGFHTGIASSIVPMYLMEISPKKSASSLGTLHVLGLNGGIFVAQLLGLENLLGTSSLWQLLFFINAVFITVGLFGLYFMPESPVYLFVVKKREEEAIRILHGLRKDPNEITEDTMDLRKEQKSAEGENISFMRLLSQSHFRKSLLIVCVLHAGQQLVGINAVFYYSTNTFRSVGLSQMHSQYGSIGCSLLNTLCAILASRLLRSFSQKSMILISTIGTTLALLILPISMTFNETFEWLNYVTIFTIFFYVFMFAIGQGPIPFMIGGQFFDSSSMGIGMSCGCFVNWFCNFLVAFAFPLLVININQFVFLIFFTFDILLMIFIFWCIPKTES